MNTLNASLLSVAALSFLKTPSSLAAARSSDGGETVSTLRSLNIRGLNDTARRGLVPNSVGMRDVSSPAIAVNAADVRRLASAEDYDPSMGDKTYTVNANTDTSDTLTMSGVASSDVILSTDNSNSLFIASKLGATLPFKVTVNAQFELSAEGSEASGFDRLVFSDVALTRDSLRDKASQWVGSDEQGVYSEHYASRLDETFVFGAGSNFVWGNKGADTYVFGRGDGNQEIIDEPELSGINNNRLVFEDISLTDVIVQRDQLDSNALSMMFYDAQGQGMVNINVANQFYQDATFGAVYGVETIAFSNVELSRSDINTLVGFTPDPISPGVPVTTAPQSTPVTWQPTLSPSNAKPGVSSVPTKAPVNFSTSVPNPQPSPTSFPSFNPTASPMPTSSASVSVTAAAKATALGLAALLVLN